MGDYSMDTATPTLEIYSELQNAFAFYNKHLFAGKLPHCVITVQRKERTFGYFSSNRWNKRDGQSADEIALNPAYFATRTIELVLSTLVHEMCHQWQQHYGKPGRGRYHNKEWADKMELVGLVPSDTGVVGGKRTGDQMTHYIKPDGPFARFSAKLVSHDFKLSWFDRFPSAVNTLIDPSGKINPDMQRLLGLSNENVNSILSAIVCVDTSRNRTKYHCADCGFNLWGKPELSIICGDCGSEYQIV